MCCQILLTPYFQRSKTGLIDRNAKSDYSQSRSREQIIGKGGKKLKHVGMEARKDLEKFFDKHVYLQLYVKVESDWRNQEKKLKAFGYIE